jgi:hypothetical protein
MYGSISAGPSAQFNPTTSGFACAIEVRNASTVWPLRIRPERSVTVPETMRGTLLPDFWKSSEMAAIAAFAFNVSKMVSTISRSTPPSISAAACSP